MLSHLQLCRLPGQVRIRLRPPFLPIAPARGLFRLPEGPGLGAEPDADVIKDNGWRERRGRSGPPERCRGVGILRLVVIDDAMTAQDGGVF